MAGVAPIQSDSLLGRFQSNSPQLAAANAQNKSYADQLAAYQKAASGGNVYRPSYTQQAQTQSYVPTTANIAQQGWDSSKAIAALAQTAMPNYRNIQVAMPTYRSPYAGGIAGLPR